MLFLTEKAFEWEARLPRFQRVHQEFDRLKVSDIPSAVYTAAQSLPGVEERCRGKRVAITAGSRGITGLPETLAALVTWVKEIGGEPFIVPAMGSHGGGTAEGQQKLLSDLGIDAGSVGAPVISSLEVVEVGRLENGMPVYADQQAAQADAIIIANRIKPHTDYSGDYESGLAKMTSIGMGKLAGADTIHRYGVDGLVHSMPQAARMIVARLPVIFGLAVLENAYHQVARIVAVPPEGIAGPEEKALLAQAYALMPRLPFPEIDVLIVEEMGKNISGVGMDPKVIGRVRVHGVPNLADCSIRTIAVLNLTEESHGNASGIGLADVTTRRLVDSIDFEATYLNCITSGITGIQRAYLPMVAPTDRAAILTALRVCGRPDFENARIVRIKNTLSLGEIDISEGLLQPGAGQGRLSPVGSPFELPFHPDGRLLPFEQALAGLPATAT
jgi:hypothetical protein